MMDFLKCSFIDHLCFGSFFKNVAVSDDTVVHKKAQVVTLSEFQQVEFINNKQRNKQTSCVIVGAGDKAQWSSTLAAFQENPSSVPSPHIGRLTTSCNYSGVEVRDSMPSSDL